VGSPTYYGRIGFFKFWKRKYKPHRINSAFPCSFNLAAPAEWQSGIAAIPPCQIVFTCVKHVHQVRQSSIVAMPPRVTYKCAKCMPFAHIRCGRAAKPRCHPTLLLHTCTTCVHQMQHSGTATLPPQVFSNMQSASHGVHQVVLGSYSV
jgi:hypothetical protein